MFAGCSIALADTVSEENALINATRFLEQSGKARVVSRAGKPMLKKAFQSRGFYAFNVDSEEGGYVISSASDKTQAVLGYSTHGSLDTATMPDPMKAWLESIDRAVENLEAGIPQEKQLTPNSVAHVANKKAIPHLVKAQWNQGDPYNLLTPSYVENGVTHAHSATGCVSTAVTQIMYYWKWPQEACKTIPSYTYNWSGQNRTTETLPPVVFNWAAMTDTYGSNSSYESKMAVAQLMVYAGHAMQSGYAGATGATSINAMNALKNYFGYNKDMFNVYHLNYTFQEWEDLIYGELSAGRPVLMGADNYERTGGHEFIIDGYDGSGLYHLNWGWGGWDDGYFVLTVMAPDNQGIGGSSDANGYSMGQNICVNLQPAYDTPIEETVHASISGLAPGQSQLTKDGEGSFSLNFNYSLHLILLNSHTFDHAFRLTSEAGDVVSDELAKTSYTLNPANRYTFNTTVKFINLADGTYILRGISRKTGTTEWILDENSDRNYFELVVEGNKMSVNVKPGKGQKLVVNSIKLEGATIPGEWQKVVYNITNNGNDFYGETYLFVDGTRSSGNTISINGGETANIYYKFKPTNTLGNHKFILSSQTNTAASNIISEVDQMFNMDCVWNADGTISALPKAASGVSYVIPADATALYLYGTTPRSISPASANPNLILYLDENAVVASRVETIWRKYINNIVYGNSAKVARFVDGYSVSIPRPFTAETASFTRNNMVHWSFLSLPFNVDKVTVDGQDADWFNSKTDVGKSLFVKQSAGGRGTQLRFTHAENILANTPYLVGVKGSLNGTDFDHTTKSVTFSGSNVTVAITGETTESYVTTSMKLVPCYKAHATSKLMALDDTFMNFVKVTQTKPFTAFLNPTSTTASYTIFYEDGELGGVDNVLVDSDVIAPESPVYNMLGVKVGEYGNFDHLQPGIYIVAGHKMVKR